jgi:hypothetical protein
MNGDESDEDNLNEEMDLEDEDSFDNDDQIIMNFGGRKMTKRQLGYLEEPMQLPNKATVSQSNQLRGRKRSCHQRP